MAALIWFAAAPSAKPESVTPGTAEAAGGWDITVRTPRGPAYSWLEVEHSGATLVGRFVGTVGHARPISRIELSNNVIRVEVPRQYEEHDLVFDGTLEPNGLAGTVTGYSGGACRWTAQRAPALRRDKAPVWGGPLALFNGRDLSGWKTVGGESHWLVKDGLLANATGGANLVTTERFTDFKLHVEFRYPAKSNSGIYLRGRYEVQIEDDEGARPSRFSNGSIYGFFAPCIDVSKNPGDWQTYDITLVGRVVTVVFNGETVIDRQTIPGITGGALDSDEGTPGPIMIQGDHGPVEFRAMTLSPVAGVWVP